MQIDDSKANKKENKSEGPSFWNTRNENFKSKRKQIRDGARETVRVNQWVVRWNKLFLLEPLLNKNLRMYLYWVKNFEKLVKFVYI